MLESPDLPPPPLVVMSLSMRTVINPKDKSNEIVSVCTSVYHEGIVRTVGRLARNSCKTFLTRIVISLALPLC